MAQSTRPASANGSARQDTRAAGRPARSSADGAVRSLAGAKASSPGNGAAGRSRRQPCTRGWKPSPPPGSAKSGAARIGWARAGPPWRTPARISSMICGSTCAGCARCPTCCHGRQARAPCVARCARKWPGPCCRGRAIGTSSRWKCCRSSAMPIRISIRKPRPRGLAPAPRSRTTRCTPTCRPNASRPCCACSGNAARRSPPPWPSARPGRCIARSAAASRVGTRRCARAWITPPTRAAAPACGADPRQTPALCQRGAVAAQSIPQARALRQGPGRRARRAGQRAGLPYSRRAGARCVCQPVDRQAGGSTRRQSGPAIAAQGRRWPALSQPAPAAAAVFLGAGQPRTGGPTPRPLAPKRRAPPRDAASPQAAAGAAGPVCPSCRAGSSTAGIRGSGRNTVRPFTPRRQACRNSAPTSAAVHSGGSGTVFEIAASTQGCSAASMAICADGAISAARRK